MSLFSSIMGLSISGENLSPKLSTSEKYKHWISIEDWRRCPECARNHGKIWLITEIPNPEPPIHPNCRCRIISMESIEAGTATINGKNGADWCLKYEKSLPNYYIEMSVALEKGWKWGKWPSNFVPNKMITAGVYENRDNHLPEKSGRIWYEADINYKAGKRNKQRIVWSNDGLIFVTYDHYETFYEII